MADLDIELAEKQVKLTEKDYFPSVNFTGTYARTGDDWQAHGGRGHQRFRRLERPGDGLLGLLAVGPDRIRPQGEAGAAVPVQVPQDRDARTTSTSK
ncbi:MAG: hypothetical protein MZV70_41930 [Desulfobacterales bacterium]|nr:hypothetical protein [Desulfobacterales bacterium]